MDIQNPIPLSLRKEVVTPLQISVESPIMLTQTQNGLARGYSAYEVAVKNGFEGTESEWLETLKEDSWDIVEFDSATSGTLICSNKVIYIVDASVRPVTAIIPDSNIFDFTTRIILNNNTHKVSVTTPTGETLIGNDTTQVIPLENAQLYIKYHTHDGKYHIITDTRQIHMLELLTENRDFSDGDGAEHLVEYRSITEEGDMFTHTLKAPQSYPGGMVLEYTFSIKGNGTVVVTCSTHPIGDRNDQVLNISGTSFTVVEANGEYFIKDDTRPKIVNTSVTSYPLNEDDALTDTVTGTFFKKRTNSVTDSEFSQTPTQQPYIITANPTDSYQCFSSSICKTETLNGLLPEGGIDIYWNLRRTGNVDINVYVIYSIRHQNGSETIIATTNTTKVTTDTLTQYRLVANHIELIILPTDRMVVRVYARKDKTGTDPVLYQEVEGVNPTRSVIEVAIATLSHNSFAGRGVADCHPIPAITGLQEIFYEYKDPTGFLDNKNIDVLYDSVNRTITLTHPSGTILYYWRAELRSLQSPWVSPVHDDVTDKLFLYSTDGENFAWTTVTWEFYDLQIAVRIRNGLFALREIHGLWNWQSHDAWHRNYGTYRKSGGGLVAGTFALNTNGDAACTPSFSSCIIKDEDLESSITLWSEGLYTILWFTGTGTMNFDLTKTVMVNSVGSFLYVNVFDGTNFSWTPTVTGRFMNLYVLRIPVTSDVNSQKYRAVVIQPQKVYTSQTAAEAEEFRSLYFGELESSITESIAIERITLGTNAAYTATGRIRILSTAILYGSRTSQITVSGAVATTMENVAFTPYKDITAINGQTAVEQVYDKLNLSEAANYNSSSIVVNNTDKIQNVNLTTGSGDLNVTFSGYPTVNSNKLLIINNNRGSDVNINLPSSTVVNGGITYVFHLTDTTGTISNGYSAELNIYYHFLDSTNCQVRMSVVNFDYKSI